jgi:hypothetical protein
VLPLAPLSPQHLGKSRRVFSRVKVLHQRQMTGLSFVTAVTICVA